MKKDLVKLYKAGVLSEEEYQKLVNKVSGMSKVEVSGSIDDIMSAYRLDVADLREETRKCYIKHAINFLDYITNQARESWDNTTLPKVSINEVNKWIENLSEQGYSANASRTYLTGLKHFFNFLRQNGYEVPDISILSVAEINKKASELDAYTDDEIKIFASHANNIRDRALIMFMYETGMKRQEVVECKLDHVDWNANNVNIYDNNNKVDRVGYFSNETKALLNEYLSELKQELNDKDIEKSEYLFQTLKSKKISYFVVTGALSSTSKNYFGKESTSKITTETLRNSRRAYYMSIGNSVTQVQVLMGDANYWRCERFLKVAQVLYPESFNKNNPSE